MPVDGTFRQRPTRGRRANIALEIPVWEPDICIQCARCSFVCPHAAIRVKLYPTELLANAPAEFKSTASKAREWKDGYSWTVQVAPEDCTGCGLCVEKCPGKDKTDPNRKAINMRPQPPIREAKSNTGPSFSLPKLDRTTLLDLVKNSQLWNRCRDLPRLRRLGETPYITCTQLFGDRMVIAMPNRLYLIYGGNLPTKPYAEQRRTRSGLVELAL
jgi:pyruvate-ferredoxin/flavodoxin oxidoreductase